MTKATTLPEPRISDTRASKTPTGNPFLEGNFGPVTSEVTATELSVTGTIPDFLDGRYLRNGPNPIGEQDPDRYQWFLGAGMVHGLRVGDGRAQWYRNRWVRSAGVARALGETWRSGPGEGGLDFSANTNVIGHAGRTLAIVEGGARPYELNDELETVGPSDFCGTLRGGYTAHPKRDPATGELHAVSYSPFRGNRVQYSVTGVDGKVRRTVDIELDASPMMHDFSLTERYVILYDLPVVLDFTAMTHTWHTRAVARMLNRFTNRHATPDAMASAVMRGSNRYTPEGLSLPYRWDPTHKARIGVLPREGAAEDIRWFDVEPCFVYHPLNAYDDGDTIVLDVVRHPKTFVAVGMPYAGPPTLDRWTVDLIGGRVREERLDDQSQEFPRVDERLVGRRHRYGYSVRSTLPRDGGFPVSETVLKHDVVAQSTQAVAFGKGRQPDEFVFVPRSADAAEDDGVLMGFVYDVASDRSDLVMLDAATLEPVATVHLPARVPHGFHGNWVPSIG